MTFKYKESLLNKYEDKYEAIKPLRNWKLWLFKLCQKLKIISNKTDIIYAEHVITIYPDKIIDQLTEIQHDLIRHYGQNAACIIIEAEAYHKLYYDFNYYYNVTDKVVDANHIIVRGVPIIYTPTIKGVVVIDRRMLKDIQG